MKYFSSFSGIGGFEYGLQSAGFECIGTSEIDKHAIAVHKHHFPGVPNYGSIKNITKISTDFDLFVGGFPCQSFSIAGKGGKFTDSRGSLFFEIIRLLECHQPRYLLLENVKGLVSKSNRQTFQVILNKLGECGYSCQWGVLNSRHYGVPQNRERVFIVGSFRTTSIPEVFPIRPSEIQFPTLRSGGKGTLLGKPATQVARCLDANMWKGTTPEYYFKKHKRNLIAQNGGVRRLTPLECERLMGFPDNWTQYGQYSAGMVYQTKKISDTQRYKMLGNSVVTRVVQTIGSKLLQRRNKC